MQKFTVDSDVILLSYYYKMNHYSLQKFTVDSDVILLSYYYKMNHYSLQKFTDDSDVEQEMFCYLIFKELFCKITHATKMQSGSAHACYWPVLHSYDR